MLAKYLSKELRIIISTFVRGWQALKLEYVFDLKRAFSFVETFKLNEFSY